MGSTYHSIHFHLVFSTKNRNRSSAPILRVSMNISAAR